MNNEKEERYIIEEILDRKVENGILTYKVRWKGYSLDECTWEPVENFDNLEAIKKYEKRQSTSNNKNKRNNTINTQSKEKKVQFDESLNKIINEENISNQIGVTPMKHDIDNNNNNNNQIKEINENQEGCSSYLSKKRSRSKQSDNHDVKRKKENIDDMSGKEKKLKSSLTSPIIKQEMLSAVVSSSGLETREGKIEKDVPLRIESAKQSLNNPQNLLCEIEWKERKNKPKLINSFYTNDQIKKKYPLLLIEYYERHLIFPQRKSK